MVKAVFDELAQADAAATTSPSASSTTSRTLSLRVRPRSRHRAGRRGARRVFFGLGADGTVGANKNSIKIIGEETDNYAQGYFVYDSKKSGAITVSHLRFGPRPIRSRVPDPPGRASSPATSSASSSSYDVLDDAAPGARLPAQRARTAPTTVWDHLPREVQEQIIEKQLRFYVIDAYDGRPRARAWAAASTRSCRPASSPSPACCRARRRSPSIKEAIEKTYGKRGEEVVRQNFAAVDDTLAHLHEVPVPGAATATPRAAAARARRTRPTSCSASRR